MWFLDASYLIHQVPIPTSLIHTLLDGPSRLETPPKMEPHTCFQAPRAKIVTPESDDNSRRLANLEELKSTRHSEDQYRNNPRNTLMKAVVNALNQQREKIRVKRKLYSRRSRNTLPQILKVMKEDSGDRGRKELCSSS